MYQGGAVPVSAGTRRGQSGRGYCAGWASHAGRFSGGQTYVFTLDMRLSRGVAAFLLDSGKRELLRIDCHTPTGVVELDGQNRYLLRWAFLNATGRCELRWPYSAV